MKLDTIATIKSIRDKLELLKLNNSQKFETYSNVELIKVCRLFVIQPIYK
jgi:hypothetical protein